MTQNATYPLRLPKSVKAAAEALAREEGISMNQFVSTAVAEKLVAMKTATFFSERRSRADTQALRSLLTRKGGQAPREGDEGPASRTKAKTGKAAA